MSRLRILGLSIVILCGTARILKPAANGATVTGHVVVTKVLSKKRVALPAYDLRGMTASPKAPEKSPNSATPIDEMQRVIVYLEGPALAPGTPDNVTLTQKDEHFDPEILAIPMGSTVSFPNADPVFHNVFSLSKVKHFDLGYYPQGQTRVVKFDQAGVVQVYCHLHADMSAAILVLPNASWVRPRSDGSFSLSGIPAGSYRLIAWHRAAGSFIRRVTVTSGQTLAVEIVIPLSESDSNSAAAK